MTKRKLEKKYQCKIDKTRIRHRRTYFVYKDNVVANYYTLDAVERFLKQC